MKGGKFLRSMTGRFLFGALVLVALTQVFPLSIFHTWPSYVVSALEIAPFLILATILLNLSFPEKPFRPGAYVPAAVLLLVVIAAYDYLKIQLGQVYPIVGGQVDTWSIGAIFLYATRPLLLCAMAAICFLFLWKACFGLQAPQPLRWRKLLNPVFLLIVAAGCVFVSYLTLFSYAQVQQDPTYAMLFGAGPPQSAGLYHLPPFVTLVLLRLYKPLEALLLSFVLLYAMRMVRGSYLLAERERQLGQAEAAAMMEGEKKPIYMRRMKPPLEQPRSVRLPNYAAPLDRRGEEVPIEGVNEQDEWGGQ